MIEIPRAALTAGEVRNEASFFSFGTNDLTQMTYGISRDDAGKFMTPVYRREDLLRRPDRVDRPQGRRQADEDVRRRGQATRPIKLGICGEHGGDPNSIEFCHEIGLNYVSCSPFRVPIARLAAAHAVLRQQGRESHG